MIDPSITTKELQVELNRRKKELHAKRVLETKENVKDVVSIVPAVAAEGFGFIGSFGKALSKLGKDFRSHG